MTYNNHIATFHTKFATLEFTRDRKAMSVIVKPEEDTNEIFIKGAPEGILESCNRVMLQNGTIVNMSSDFKNKVNGQVTEMAQKALRCLAIAYKDDHIFKDYNGP